MSSRLPFKTEDFDRDCGCTFQRWQSQQSARTDTGGGRQKGRKKEYSDADFAREIQGLSLQERERVYEDVHLATGQVRETEEFLNTKVKELLDVIKNHSKQRVQRDAWDRAVFLRPTLAKDRDHSLMFLRAKNYDAYDAAMLVFKFYETKRRLWGDELLARRIGWGDLSEDTRAVFDRSYAIWLPRNKESPSRKVWYDRSSTVDLVVVDPLDYVRALMYSFFCNTFGNEDIHRKGHIVICDLRGPFKMSTFQYLDLCHITLPMFESLPGRVAVVHFLVEESAMIGIVRSMQALSCRDRRLRVQIHVGSWMEIQYSLRSYGIDIAADWKKGNVDGSPFSSESTRQEFEDYRRIEGEWKQSEAPYCDPSSAFALYPNPHDIIMGKNRSIAPSWPGNVAYTTLIHEYTAGYGIVTTRHEKTAMAKEILHRLKTEFRVRFLNRKENEGWEAASDEEARLKVSQSLRDEYRKIFNSGTF